MSGGSGGGKAIISNHRKVDDQTNLSLLRRHPEIAPLVGAFYVASVMAVSLIRTGGIPKSQDPIGIESKIVATGTCADLTAKIEADKNNANDKLHDVGVLRDIIDILTFRDRNKDPEISADMKGYYQYEARLREDVVEANTACKGVVFYKIK